MEVLQMFEKSQALDPTSHFIHYARKRFQQIAFSLNETWTSSTTWLSCFEDEDSHETAWGFTFGKWKVPLKQHDEVMFTSVSLTNTLKFCLEVKIEHKRIHDLGFCQPYQWWVKDWTFQFTPWCWEVLQISSSHVCPKDGRISTRKWQEGKLISCQEPFPGRKGHHRSFFFFQSHIDIIGEIFSFHIFHEFWEPVLLNFGEIYICEFSRVLPKQTTNKRVCVASWANSWGLAVRGSSINKMLPVQAQLIDDSILLPRSLT